MVKESIHVKGATDMSVQVNEIYNASKKAHVMVTARECWF